MEKVELERRLEEKERELYDLRAWAIRAWNCVDKATEIMSLAQLGEWPSYRAVIESCPIPYDELKAVVDDSDDDLDSEECGTCDGGQSTCPECGLMTDTTEKERT